LKGLWADEQIAGLKADKGFTIYEEDEEELRTCYYHWKIKTMTARGKQLLENSDLWQSATLGIVLPARKGTKDSTERAGAIAGSGMAGSTEFGSILLKLDLEKIPQYGLNRVVTLPHSLGQF
jgi:hypothetical protein